MPGADGPAARRGRGLRRRRQQRGRHVLPVSSTTPRSSWSASRRAAAAPPTGEHAATLSHGKPGVLHGTFSYVLQDDDGQTAACIRCRPASIIPASAPSTATGRTAGRVRYTSVGDAEALEAFHLCSRLEGILPALETAHAVVEAMRDRGEAAEGRRGGRLLLRPRRQGLLRGGPASGRGDLNL